MNEFMNKYVKGVALGFIGIVFFIVTIPLAIGWTLAELLLLMNDNTTFNVKDKLAIWWGSNKRYILDIILSFYVLLKGK